MEEEIVLDGGKGRVGMMLEGTWKRPHPLGSFAHGPPLKKNFPWTYVLIKP